MEAQGFFIPDKQITARLAKSIDWNNHPLGPSENWPLSLRLTLNSLFNTRQAVCLFWGEQSHYFYNDAYIPILGENKHPWAMGKTGIEVWGEVWDVINPQIQQVMTTGVASWNEDQFLPIIRAELPQEAWFTYSYSPVIDENGKIQGTLVICIETTARIRSQQHFSLITEAIPQLVWTAKPDGYCDFLSQQWVDYTGIPASEQLGYAWLEEVIHPDDRKRTSLIWEGATKDQNQYDLEYRVKRYDGIYRWFKVRGTPLRNQEGKITYWVGTCTDIEDAIQAQITYEKNVDNSPAILWITEKDGSCSYLSQQWYEFTGQQVSEGLGYGWLEATHPDDKERAGKTFLDANKNHTLFRVEYRLRDKSGQYRWAIDAGNPRFDSEGNYLGMAGTVFDVHERKLAEQAAKESRESMYRILMQVPAAFAFLKSPDLIYTIVNDRYKEIIGKGDAILNQPIRKALPELEEDTHKIFEKIYRDGISYSALAYKATLKRKGKSDEGYFNFHAERVLDAHGNPEGIVLIVLEVTEQVLARKALEEVNKKLEAIVHNISEGLIIANAEKEMILWNAAALELHGFKSFHEAQIKLETFPELFQTSALDGNELPMEQWPISRVFNGDTFHELEVQVTRKDTGHSWYASYSGTPIFDQMGKLTMALLTVRDVTRKFNTEHDLKRAINARDEFMSVASHELKTPLTSLKLQTQSAKRRLSMTNHLKMTPENLTKVLSQNEGQINRLVRLVDDMLDLTRVQSGKLQYYFSDVNLCEVLTDVCDRLKEQFDHANIQLEVDCGREIHLTLDRERIEQVVINLLTNALKYGNHKPVTVSLRSDTDYAHIQVKDQGMGISSENQEIIFDRFQRLVSANDISGLGIGLYVTKEIVEAHQGKIWVESIPQQGSTFHVELPIHAP